MPDISMCPGGDCPHKEDCYRYKAKASSSQSFTDFNAERVTGNCSSFMRLWKRKRVDEQGSIKKVQEKPQKDIRYGKGIEAV